MMSARRPSWSDDTLGALAKYINGRAFRPEEWTSEGVPIIRIENLNDPSARVDYFQGKLDDRHHVDSGDLLVSWSATLDVFWWERGPGAVNQHIFKVIENPDKVGRKFLYFLLKSVMEQLRSQVHGSTMKHVTKPKFEGLAVRIPTDQDIQDQLVERLENELEQAERTREALATQFHAARALLEAVIDEAFLEQEELGSLGQVLIEPARAGWSPACDDLPGGTPVLTISSVTGFDFKPSAFKLTSEPTRENAHYWANEGDLLMTRSNTLDLVGHVAIVRDLPHPTIFPDLLMRLSLKRDQALPEFVHLWLMSRTVRTFVRTNARGSSGTMKKVTQQIVNEIPFPTGLSTADQDRLITTVRSRVSAAKALVSASERSLEAARLLPSSIIREAFLVPNLDTVIDD
jgi:type I restriction enzyme S subunit